MPGVTIHLLLAERVLDRWRRRPARAPFDPGDPGALNAFRQGAFGPDIGYFPGGWRPLSDLAHCLGSARLTRRLVGRARTPLERAFAAGWLTHVLADPWVHPLIGCAVGELLHGSPSVFVDGDSDPATHVKVEAGLDAIYALRHPELRAVELEPVFDDHSIAFLTEAYAETYGVAVDREAMLRSHLTSARRAAQGLGLAAMVARTVPGASERPLRAGEGSGPVHRLRERLGGHSQTLAFLFPAYPPLWLLDAVSDVEDGFVDHFGEVYGHGLSDLVDYNLDTGRPEELDPGHGGHRRARAWVGSASSTALSA